MGVEMSMGIWQRWDVGNKNEQPEDSNKNKNGLREELSEDFGNK
jgi:hypothetical protein